MKLEDIEKEGPIGLPFIKHNEWTEDGQRYSSWTIHTGKSILHTGDGGMKMFLEAMRKEGFKTNININK